MKETWNTIAKIFSRMATLCVGLFLTLLILSVIDQVFVGNQYSNTYNAALVDKYERLQKVESPKIILVGNSNLAFGIDSERLETKTGMPVVNMGYLGSFGNEFHERMIYGNVGDGDIIIIAHTSYADDDSIGYIPAVWVTMDCNRELYELMRLKDVLHALPGYPNYLRNAFILKVTGRGNRDTGDSYSRNAFNEEGDVVVRVVQSQMNPETFFAENAVGLPEVNDICIGRLNELNEYVNSCGATMVIAAYPIAYGKYSDYDENDVLNFQNALESRLNCKVISDFTDYIYSYDLFYDQVYHLTEKGAIIRTDRLGDDIVEAGLLAER